MKNGMISVLQISNLSSGGIQSHIISIYQNIDRSKIKFDFLVFKDEKEFYDEELKRLGGEKVVLIPKKYHRRIWDLYIMLKREKYDIVDLPLSSPNAFGWLICMRLAGIRNICIHAHSTGVIGNTIMEKAKRQVLYRISNGRFACSGEAAEYIFGRKNKSKICIENNGIEAEKFAFSEKKRMQIRESLQLNNQYVVGHVGRFAYPKNQKFLIELFNQLVKVDNNFSLLLIGAGEDKKEVIQLVAEYKLEGKVTILDPKSNIQDYYCAMDAFVLPSFFEGFPIVGVEAQASGLPMIVSDKVTRDINLTGQVEFLELSVEKWIDEILRKKTNSIEKRQCAFMDIRNAGFDIKEIAKELEYKYEQMCCR